MKKVILVGNSACVHALGEALKRSGAQVYVYAQAQNPGLLGISEDYQVGSLIDFQKIKEYAFMVKPDFVFIGPGDPIAEGLADFLLALGINSVAPFKTVARLESSKSFTRDLLKKYHIPGNPRFKVFYDDEGMREFVNDLEGNFVVKADGLIGGRGVKVSGDHFDNSESGIAYARECLAQAGRVVLEEKLIGQEFSFMFFCDGLHLAPMPPVQDHKRALEGDKGSNTAGMGSYSDADHLLPFLIQKDLDEAIAISHQVVGALFKETGAYFKGIIFGGFMVTANGLRLLEYNARIGDPEGLNVLPLLKTNFVDICEAVINGDLHHLSVEFQKKATVCKYIVPAGYPDESGEGNKLEIGSLPSPVRTYYAWVRTGGDDLVISSQGASAGYVGRSVAFLGIGDTLQEAERIAEAACQKVKGPIYWRKDIGTKALIQQRVEMMRKLRV